MHGSHTEAYGSAQRGADRVVEAGSKGVLGGGLAAVGPYSTIQHTR